VFRIISFPILSKFYSRLKSESEAVEHLSVSDVELRSRTATSPPLNAKGQALGAVRSDLRLHLVCRYKYPSSPSVLLTRIICPRFPSLFVFLSPPSSPRRRPRRFTAGQPTPWRSAPTSRTIHPAPRRCSASRHQVRVRDALIQSSVSVSSSPIGSCQF
jgi:hypothetical protein